MTQQREGMQNTVLSCCAPVIVLILVLSTPSHCQIFFPPRLSPSRPVLSLGPHPHSHATGSTEGQEGGLGAKLAGFSKAGKAALCYKSRGEGVKRVKKEGGETIKNIRRGQRCIM